MSYMSENDKKVLELETRKKIYFTVKQFAGSHFREIQRKSGLAVGSVQHHLHYLVKSGLVKEVKKDNNLVYFPREFTSENTMLLGLLRQENLRKIILFIMMNKHCNHEQIVNYVNLSPSTISWHLKKLQQEGIVKADKQGRKTFYKLTCDEKEIVNLLITYQESFVDKLVDRVVEMWSL